MLEKEINSENNNGFGSIQSIVNELSSKEVSVLQIMDDDAGIITLNDQDYMYIEKLCRASLISKEEYFPTLSVPLTFDFPYVQSYIIRKHFLRCRINYRHIAQKYQCYIRRIPGTTTIITDDIETFNLDEKYTVSLSSQQLETDWNHLKEMPLDKLYHGYRLLKQIVLMLKHQENDRSSDYLYDFIKSIDDNDDLHQQLEQYEVKNFKLCHIDHVRKLYETSITGFEHLFTDVSHLLRVPIKTELNTELTEMLKMSLINVDYDNQIDKINEIIRTITDFLNELKEIEDMLLQRSTQSLTTTCEFLGFDNPIVKLIPENIKCENYVPLNIYFIKIRSSLQERIININEKEIKLLWNEDFDINSQHKTQQNCFQNYLDAENGLTQIDEQDGGNDEDHWNLFPTNNDYSNYNNIADSDLLFTDEYSPTQQNQITTTDNQTFYKMNFDEKIEYSVLVQLVIKVVPLTASTFIQKIHEQRQKAEKIEPEPITKAQKFIVTYPDPKTVGHLWKGEKLYEQLRKVFKEKKYDCNTLVVVDKDQIFVDFINNNNQPMCPIPLEYHIIEKTLLIQIHFQFQTKIFKYMVTSSAKISTVINRFIHDNDLQLKSPDIYLNFSDEFGKCINGETIADISANKLINIIVTEENVDNGTLCEVTLHPNEGRHFLHQIQRNIQQKYFVVSTSFL